MDIIRETWSIFNTGFGYNPTSWSLYSMTNDMNKLTILQGILFQIEHIHLHSMDLSFLFIHCRRTHSPNLHFSLQETHQCTESINPCRSSMYTTKALRNKTRKRKVVNVINI